MFHRCLLIYFKWHFPDLISTTFSQSKRKRNQNCNLQALLWTSREEGKNCIIKCMLLSHNGLLATIPLYAKYSPSSQFNSRHKAEPAQSAARTHNTEQQLQEATYLRLLEQYLVHVQQVPASVFTLDIYS